MQCFKNAEPVNEISLLDRAFHYGDGCFTTGRIRESNIELKSAHLARLQKACEMLSLQADLSLIEKSLAQLSKQHEAVEGTFKVVISRGEGQRGYSLPITPADIWFYFYPKPVGDFNYEIMPSGVLTQQLGQVMPSLVGLKTLNRLEQILLKAESDQNNWVEALVTDVHGAIVEGVSSNCFMLIDQQWVTPELGGAGVHGIMRAEILKRMLDNGIACKIRRVDFEEIKNIRSLFFCNALSPMKIASALHEQPLNTQNCIHLFQQLQLNQIH